ncbi:MAG: filamentous hemagglutinin family protein, partial [Terrimicrobiaceae bacterium]
LNSPADYNASSAQWLPTTLFLGKGGFDVSAAGDLLLGPTVNPFLLPGGLNNSFWRKSYFSTYAPDSEVNVTSLGGNVTLRQNSTTTGLAGQAPILRNWMQAVHLLSTNPRSVSLLQPWLRLVETSLAPFDTSFTVLPSTFKATSFGGDINLVGRFNLSPAALGTIELASAGALNGLQPTGILQNASTANLPLTTWSSATVNLSDASPGRIPGLNNPFGYQTVAGTVQSNASRTSLTFFLPFSNLFLESGSSEGDQAVIQTQQALHGTSLLHAADPEPIRLYALGGNLSGLTLFSAKAAKVVAAGDISDIAFYIQNTKDSDLSMVSSGRNIIAYNANSLLRVSAQSAGNVLNTGQTPLAGDLQISGPGALAVLAGRNLDLGVGLNNDDGTGVGLTSIGNARNPNLPFAGASIIAAAGIGPAAALSASSLDFPTLISQVVAGPDGARYLTEVAASIPGLPLGLDLSGFEALDPELQARVALEVFYLALRDAGRNSTLAGSPSFGSYATGFAAIDALFGSLAAEGEITTRSRDIRTRSGGNISLLAPGGGLTLTTSSIGPTLAPPGIITEAGGNISIFTRDSVDIGISRIFTLRGGNQIIWSSTGDIAAGSSSKTVQSAPPTRVLIDAQSAELKVDLAGLATGGGIGVLATVGGVPPGNVDLIAPVGTVDAGDAGIRATGDLNIAAVQVLNADNISVGGRSTGIPVAPVVAAPNIAGLTAASNTSGAATTAATAMANQPPPPEPDEEKASLITVDVLGYGGGEEE